MRISRAERPDGKRHDHQTRIRRGALKQVVRRFKGTAWNVHKTFSELHSFLGRRIGSIPGIGELMVYDTALRIGAKLGLHPKGVYLHRGTRSGVRALGLDTDRPFINVYELPRELRTLRPHEIEDCLCIYKAELARRAA